MTSTAKFCMFYRPGRSAVVAVFVAALVAGSLPAAENSPSAAAPLPALPEPISSFGAAVSGDWVYVYSGHTGEAHSHSKKNLSQSFLRLNLAQPTKWEQLPMGPGLQGLAVVAHDGAIYRVGGLSAKNEPGEPSDLVSLVEFAKFDTAAKSWAPLEALPEGRSSHDAVAADGKIFVVGGWTLGGEEENWLKHSLAYDVKSGKWSKLPEQPFQRRALAAAYHDGKVFAIGGMSPKGPSLDVHYFDVAAGKWSAGPSVPEGEQTSVMNGFGCSAYAVGGRLYLSTMDGVVHALSADGKAWETVGKLPLGRFFHRMLPHGDRELLIIAGASKQGHLATIERFTLPQSGE